MKKALPLFYLLATCLALSAQSEKPAIAIQPFTASQDYSGYTTMIYEMVSNTITESNRFDVVDRSKWSAVQQERELQKGVEFFDGKIAEQGRSMGATHVVTGHIGSITTSKLVGTSMLNGQQFYYYTSTINLTLKVIDVATGQVTNTETINVNNNGHQANITGVGLPSTPDVSIREVIRKVNNKVKTWVSAAFPVTITIVQILEKDDRKGAKSILISGGSGCGLQKGTDLNIVTYQEIDLNGKKINRTIEVAKAEVTKVEDANFSECKVKTEGLNVLKHINEGKTLYAITLN